MPILRLALALLLVLPVLSACSNTNPNGDIIGSYDAIAAYRDNGCRVPSQAEQDRLLQRHLTDLDPFMDREAWAAKWRKGWREEEPRRREACARQACQQQPLGACMTNDDIRGYATTLAGSYARSYCQYLSSEGRPLSAFAPVPHDRAQIATWAQEQFGPDRAGIYMRTAMPVFAREMARCRAEEAGLRRAGSGVYQQAKERDLERRLDRLEREQREHRHE